MYDGLFTTAEWDLLEYKISMDRYKKEQEKCLVQNSTENNKNCSAKPNSGVPLTSLRRVPSDFEEGYVTERRAGRYIERKVVTVQQKGGSFIRKLPHDTLFDGTVVKPYVRMCDIDEVDYDYTVDCETGELLTYQNIRVDPKKVRFMRTNESRFANPRQVRKSCEAFKWLIRANESRVRLFITLTYARNMTDTRVLYQDYRRFWQELKRKVPDVDGYLVAFEPQKRGAWHAHLLILSSNAALYISNKKVHAIWGRGFTKTQRPRDKRDIGAYLTSYLTNVREGITTKKGARLGMYPAGFHFLRHSKKISYVDVRKWHGRFDRYEGVDEFELLYDYQNVRKLSRFSIDAVYQQTKVICISTGGPVTSQ